MRLNPVLVVAASAATANAYCQSMGYPARTSKDFPPGWNGLAKTPPRGWRSWYAYYTHMNQQMIEDAIDALAAKNRTVKGWDGEVSLCDLGYCSAGIDEGWEGCGLGVNGTQHYVNGTPAVNPTTFPDMKGLVDYGHSHGVKMGWYFNGCGCIEKTEPASGWDVNCPSRDSNRCTRRTKQRCWLPLP
jgi:alpha-galactosidase